MAMALDQRRTPSIAEMAKATPASRDRFVDLLRALSIAVVVFGHWLAAVVYWDGDTIQGSSALDEISWAWMLTWVLQVMPLFFFVGGFSNAVSLAASDKRNGTYSEFLRSRIERIMRPTLVFVGAWVVIAAVADVAFGSTTVRAATPHIAKPLWFLSVYVLVIALSPAMLKLHRRYRLKVPIVMVAAATVIDVVRIAFDVPHIGYLNFAFVWLFPHQLGFFYADGSLTKLGKRGFATLATAGFGVLFVLTNIGVYSKSMVGTMTTDLVSNNDPPSICLLALTIGLVGLAMTVRDRANRWLQGARPWGAVIAANAMIMTVFLWHLTALMVVVLVLYPLGFPQPDAGSAQWWLTRPLWWGAASIVLAGFVFPLVRFERPRINLEPRADRELTTTQIVAGITLLIVGLGGLAQGGVAGLLEGRGTELAFFTANPMLSAFHTFVGCALLLGRGRYVVTPVLVLLGIAELSPVANALSEVMPVTTANATLHLAAGAALGISGRGRFERSER
jgi:fucose 4-O-acetylase-like acetyltransferase